MQTADGVGGANKRAIHRNPFGRIRLKSHLRVERLREREIERERERERGKERERERERETREVLLRA